MAYNIENSLPSGYVTDGSVDYTTYLQNGINANTDIVFPAFPIMVNYTGIIIPSNRTVTFLTGSQLIMKPTDKGSYNAIRIYKATNVTLNNPVVIGDRYDHIGEVGEWGHGIAVYASSNVTINNPVISNCWGDGLYIASSDSITNTNIVINNASCSYCRRNGISITSANGIILNSPYCYRTWGVLPMCGIDIEPNSKTDEIQNVIINNPKTEKSYWYGISIGLSELFGGTDKTIGVKIIDWEDWYSKAALRASINLNRRVGTEKISGVIDIINPFWKDNSIAPWQVDIRTTDVKLNLSTPLIRMNLAETDARELLTKKENVNVNTNYTITF